MNTPNMIGSVSGLPMKEMNTPNMIGSVSGLPMKEMKESEVSGEFNNMGVAIESLKSRLNVLEDRIKPALCEKVSKKVSGKLSPTLSPIGNALRLNTEKIEYIIGYVDELIERVVL